MTSAGPPRAAPRTDPPRPHHIATTIRCVIVDTPAAAGEHHRIRREVFVVEQAVFVAHDVDDHDEASTTIKVLGFCGDTPAGTVRLFPISRDGTEWQGDRLAVLAPFRHRRVGAPLVEFAVRTAAQRGGHRMTAHIQVPNVRFFEALGWTRCGAMESYVGLPHQPMAVDVRRRCSGHDATEEAAT